jgi:hypothetical protein
LSDPEPQPPAITERVIAQFNSYEGMLAAMRLRAKEREIAIGSDNVAALTGLPAFYFGKLLSPKAPRRIGSISMAPVMAILGVKLVMVEDPETMARYASRLHKRDENFVHAATVHFALSGKHMRAIRRKGGLNSRRYMSAREARALARRAAHARWAKAREGNGKADG